MIFQAGDFVENADGKYYLEVKSEISETEIIELNTQSEGLLLYTHVNKLWDMVVQNGMILEKYLRETSKIKVNNSDKQAKIIDRANKLVLDYCASIGVFLSGIKRRLEDIDMRRLESFDVTRHEIFDNYIEYRFWVKMRDYLIHYDLPYSAHHQDLMGNVLICKKSHLLQFSKWGQAKYDIQKMDECIDLSPMIKPMNVHLTALFMSYVYYIADKIEQAGMAMINFKNKYNLTYPCIISAESDEELKSGEFSLKEINLSLAKEAVEVALRHPYINS